MNIKNTLIIFLVFAFSPGSCLSQKKNNTYNETPVVVGANQVESYLPLIKNKRIGIVANQTSVIFRKNNKYTHIVDSLSSLNVKIKKVFAPEHGFRGKADAGEFVKNGKDPKTGIEIVSIYGSNKKPTKTQLENLDLLIFDIQDVGARFYTYISSLHYIMEACAENSIPLLILDRPNPNGHYTDGPILELENKSFVGMHPIPIVHGMTIGEYAQMINGEKWLKNSIKCDLKIIKCENYYKELQYSLPIKPSPNLPNDQSINLYPSLCFFEGTNISVGRGTEMQFQVFGAPFLPKTNFQFKPQPNDGAKKPKHNNSICYGKDLRNTKKLNTINLEWLISCYCISEKKDTFFNSFFTKLAGTKNLKKQIENGLNSTQIRSTWQKGLNEYDEMRKEYLIY